MARILAIDDDSNVLDMVAMVLEDAGHEVTTAADGLAGLALHEQQAFDAIVSDVNMPRLDGYGLCQRLRERRDATPLLLLTARSTDIDEALGLDFGADDYLTKPFSTRVLTARVRAILRRSARVEDPTAPLVRGALLLDVDRLLVRFHERTVTVTVTEFRLLEALARRPGHVQSRDRLLEEARHDDSIVAPRLIDTYIRRLRRKLEDIEPGFSAIETVIGAGYRWRE